MSPVNFPHRLHVARLRRSHLPHPSHPYALEPLEPRLLLSAAVESVTGANNNLAHPNWGTAGSDLLRLAVAAYADGVSSPALPNDQSARAISNILNNQANPANPSQDIQTIDQNSLSDFGYSFGQFMDHDLDHTADGGAAFPIAVASTDPMGPNPIPFTRSQTNPATGTSAANPLQQITDTTSYLDLSQVYGSSQTVADALRTFNNGLLKTSPGNMLPYDSATYFTPSQIAALNMANDSHAVATSQLFAAGDVRANENVELTALQTLFVRNHNRLAAALQNDHPAWTDEQLFQEARKLNIAQYQSIVYNEWIPAVLGPNALSKYTGYNPNVNATISNEFSTVAFRFGHSLLSAGIERHNNNGSPIASVNPNGSTIALSQDFFDPNVLNPNGTVDPLTNQTASDIGPLLKAQADGNSQAMDLLAVNDVRNLLFGNGGFGGEDLMARDVQRDRDNGIPDYNTLRKSLGLSPVTTFAQITSNVQAQQQLQKAYPGGVNTIDAFEGGLAEDHVPGSDVGPLFQAIMVDQFQRLRDGDRFFYLNENLNAEERNILQQGNTLTKVIEANTPITNLQSDAFIFNASVSGTVSMNMSLGGRNSRLSTIPLPGLTVQLKDEAGNVLATTKTDREGHYSFSQLSGAKGAPALSAVGTYTLSLRLPSNVKYATYPSPIVLTRGGTTITNANFTMDMSSLKGTLFSNDHPFNLA